MNTSASNSSNADIPTDQKSSSAFKTIREVADELDLPQHVLRFWETRFSHIKPLKRAGGRRFYRPDEVELLRTIRNLLYAEGYTIRGVQRLLKERGPKALLMGQTSEAPPPPAPSTPPPTTPARRTRPPVEAPDRTSQARPHQTPDLFATLGVAPPSPDHVTQAQSDAGMGSHVLGYDDVHHDGIEVYRPPNPYDLQARGLLRPTQGTWPPAHADGSQRPALTRQNSRSQEPRLQEPRFATVPGTTRPSVPAPMAARGDDKPRPQDLLAALQPGAEDLGMDLLPLDWPPIPKITPPAAHLPMSPAVPLARHTPPKPQNTPLPNAKQSGPKPPISKPQSQVRQRPVGRPTFPPSRALAPEAEQTLKAALYELSECERILRAALKTT